MGKYFITGNAGAGKSTVIAALQRRGFTAHDTDDLPEVTLRVKPKHSELEYANVWDRTALEKLLASDDDVFIGASVSNQDEFYSLFDKLFCLSIGKEALEHRLRTRTNNNFGNDPSHRQFILDIHDRVETNLRHVAAIIIDASLPIDDVVEEILAKTDVKR